jgi:hypothetical protein
VDSVPTSNPDNTLIQFFICSVKPQFACPVLHFQLLAILVKALALQPD